METAMIAEAAVKAAKAKAKTMAGENLIKVMETMEMELGFDTIVSDAFDAIYNFIHHELMLTVETAETEDDQTVIILRGISDKVYDMCEKAKGDVRMIEAYRMAK